MREGGAHYTPADIAASVVEKTLTPILRCLGEAPTAGQITSLKICDPAVGSGIFLVHAARFLGPHLVQAWERAGDLPEAIERSGGDPLRLAKRILMERCLYGVDIDRRALEIAKLALSLETLGEGKALVFVNHMLRHGDALVGLDLDQIKRFHWNKEAT